MLRRAQNYAIDKSSPFDYMERKIPYIGFNASLHMKPHVEPRPYFKTIRPDARLVSLPTVMIPRPEPILVKPVYQGAAVSQGKSSVTGTKKPKPYIKYALIGLSIIILAKLLKSNSKP